MPNKIREALEVLEMGSGLNQRQMVGRRDQLADESQLLHARILKCVQNQDKEFRLGLQQRHWDVEEYVRQEGKSSNLEKEPCYILFDTSRKYGSIKCGSHHIISPTNAFEYRPLS